MPSMVHPRAIDGDKPILLRTGDIVAIVLGVGLVVTAVFAWFLIRKKNSRYWLDVVAGFYYNILSVNLVFDVFPLGDHLFYKWYLVVLIGFV